MSTEFETKALFGQMSVDEAEGIVECFVAGVGNKDSVGDIVLPGAFDGSLKRRKPRVVWGHNWNEPIGKVLQIYEVPPSDPRLPQKMRNARIGGLFAKVQFNLKSERGREAFANVIFFGPEQEWCVDPETEILTDRGWLRYDEVTTEDQAYVLNPELGWGQFEPIGAVNIWDSKVRSLRHIETGGFSSLTTAAHRWPLASNVEGGNVKWTTTEELDYQDRIIRAAPRFDAPNTAKYSDSFVELVGWFWTEGWVPPADHTDAGLYLAQSTAVNPQHVAAIRAALEATFPGQWSERHSRDEMARFRITRAAAKEILDVTGDDKEPTPSFLTSLTRSQLQLMIDTCLNGDGHKTATGQRTWYQVSEAGVRSFEMLCALAGQPTSTTQQKDYGNRYGQPPQRVSLLKSGVAKPLDAIRVKTYNDKPRRTPAVDEWVDAECIVWCPTTPSGTWLARRKGTVYFTGNSIGYKTIQAVYDNARQANLLKEVELYEVSPVLHGANQLTATISIKSDKQDEDRVSSFGKSKWKMFDREFAEMVKNDHPDIWDKGGNIKGDDQYTILTRIAEQGGVAETEDQIKALELREAWVARHEKDFLLAGVVAQIKWLAIGSRGEGHMKDVIREAIAKKTEKKNYDWDSGDQENNVDLSEMWAKLRGYAAEEDSSFTDDDDDDDPVGELEEIGESIGVTPKEALAQELANKMRSPVKIRSISGNTVVFDVMRENDVETMRSSWHAEGNRIMIGKPERVRVETVYLPIESNEGEAYIDDERTKNESCTCGCMGAEKVDPRAGIPQERFTGDVLRGYGPRRGNLERLLRYWRPIMRKPGGFRRCLVILADHPELYPLQNICAWLHHETTGLWPNEGCHHPGMKNCRRKLRGVVRGSLWSNAEFDARMAKLRKRSTDGKAMDFDDEDIEITDEDIDFANKVLNRFLEEEKEFAMQISDDKNWEHVGEDEEGSEKVHGWIKPTEMPTPCGCGKSDPAPSPLSDALADLNEKAGRAINSRNAQRIAEAIRLLTEIIDSGSPVIEQKSLEEVTISAPVADLFDLRETIDPVIDHYNLDAVVTETGIHLFNVLDEDAQKALNHAIEAFVEFKAMDSLELIEEKGVIRNIRRMIPSVGGLGGGRGRGGGGRSRRGRSGGGSRRFDPNAVDADGDGTLQDSTPFERPVRPKVGRKRRKPKDRGTANRVTPPKEGPTHGRPGGDPDFKSVPDEELVASYEELSGSYLAGNREKIERYRKLKKEIIHRIESDAENMNLQQVTDALRANPPVNFEDMKNSTYDWIVNRILNERDRIVRRQEYDTEKWDSLDDEGKRKYARSEAESWARNAETIELRTRAWEVSTGDLSGYEKEYVSALQEIAKERFKEQADKAMRRMWEDIGRDPEDFPEDADPIDLLDNESISKFVRELAEEISTSFFEGDRNVEGTPEDVTENFLDEIDVDVRLDPDYGKDFENRLLSMIDDMIYASSEPSFD